MCMPNLHGVTPQLRTEKARLVGMQIRLLRNLFRYRISGSSQPKYCFIVINLHYFSTFVKSFLHFLYTAVYSRETSRETLKIAKVRKM